MRLCHRIHFLLLCLLDKVYLFGWTLQKDIGPEKQKRFMVNRIHLQNINTLNSLCQVKGHEQGCLEVSPTVQEREKAAELWDSQ